MSATSGEQTRSISIHALCEEGDGSPTRPTTTSSNFYPRPLRGGRPKELEKHTYIKTNFYPRPLRGGRLLSMGIVPGMCLFLSTPSARRATASTRTVASPVFYFYPRPLRGGRPEYNEDMKLDELKISIHALCEEGDLRAASSAAFRLKFLSTPSARRATCGLLRLLPFG